MNSIEQDAEAFLAGSSNQATQTEESPKSSIEADAEAFLSSKQQSSGAPSAMEGLQGESPLSFTQRAALSFAGDNKENVLKRDFKYVEKLPNGKFAVGNDLRELQPIDPEGVFNDMLGDIADVASWVAPITASTAAATAAIPADIASGNPMPSIIAAGRGMAIGEAFNKVVGKKIGVNA